MAIVIKSKTDYHLRLTDGIKNNHLYEKERTDHQHDFHIHIIILL